MSVNFKLGLARFGANLALANFHLNVNSSKNLQANSASVNFDTNSQASANSATFANSVLFSMMMHTLVC